MATLVVEHLTKRYGALTAVNDVSFTLNPGEVVGYFGPNGSGKSTTVRMLAGLVEPSNGTILHQGVPIDENLDWYKSRVGFVPEETFVYGHLTSTEYLRLSADLRALPRPGLEQRIDRLVELFDLWETRYALLSSLSKGMRHKVLLAAALLHNPRLLILDEPGSGLDITSLFVLRALLRGLAAAGTTVLFTSHDFATVEAISSRVLVIAGGRLVADDAPVRLKHTFGVQSLEEVFALLTVDVDVEARARAVLDALI